MEKLTYWWSRLSNPHRSQPHDGPTATASSQAHPIKYYDQQGRKRFATRAEWRRNVLPRQLTRFQDEPRQLQRLIGCAIEYGFPYDALPAADRLIALEPELASHHALKARILIQCGMLEWAERTLREFTERRGQHAAVMSAQASLHAARNETAESIKAIKVALALDANDAETLDWWRRLCEAQHGEGGEVIAWQQASRLPGSWRAQLLLANRRLQDGNEDALEHYRGILPSVADNRDAIEIIARDLREAHCFEDLIGLVQPIYEPSRHGPRTGLHLLDACVRLRDAATGKAILHAMFMEHRHELRHELQSYANQFMILDHEAAKDLAEDSESFVIMENA